MAEAIGHYKAFIMTGIMIIPSFLYMLFSTIYLIDKRKRVKQLIQMRNPLIGRINDASEDRKREEESVHILDIVSKIRDEIHAIREELHKPQDKGRRRNEKCEIEKDIDAWYENMKNPNMYMTGQRTSSTNHDYESQDEKILHREQVRIMNQNIAKFVSILKNKQEMIHQKDRLISELQQRMMETEQRLEMERHEQKTRRIEDIEIKLEDIETELYEIRTGAEKESMTDKQRALSEIERKIRNEEKSISILIAGIFIMIFLVAGIVIANLR